MKRISFDKSLLAKQWAPVLLVLLLLFFGSQYHTFLSPASLNNLLRQMAVLLIASMGMSIVILMGSIDVSVGAALTFSGTIAALTCPFLGWASIFAGVFAGGLVGLSNGLIATKFKIPTFLSTIAMMGILNGVSTLILKGSPLNIDSKAYLAITKGTLIGNISNITLIPIPIILLTILLLKKTVLGRSIYAIGGNKYVAYYSGIKVVSIQVLAFTINGLFVGLAGSLQASLLEAACPFMGDSLTLPVIAVVVMGGIPLSGGKGSALGAILGAALITVLASGMTFMGVTPEIRNIAMGILIIIGAISTLDRSRAISVK